MRIRCLSTGGRLYCPGEERLAGNSLNPRLPAGTIPQMHWALSQAPPQSSPLRATGTAQQLNGALLKGKSLSSHSSTHTHFTLITVSNSETLRNHIMPNWNPWCIPSRQREVLLTAASPSSTTHILHWKHLRSWRAYRVSTSQNPLFKHYRIQSSLLALNNPKCLLAQITGVQPHCGSQAFLRQVSSLVARMAQNKGKSWQRGHGRACAAPSLASPRSLGHSTAVQQSPHARDLHSHCHTLSKGSFLPSLCNFSCHVQEPPVFTDEPMTGKHWFGWKHRQNWRKDVKRKLSIMSRGNLSL